MTFSRTPSLKYYVSILYEDDVPNKEKVDLARMGFGQEVKAESAVESLKKMTTPSAKVKRGGKTMICSSEEVVPGDIIELEAGDRVPADARIIWEVASSVDESMLTGESEMVQKDWVRNSDAWNVDYLSGYLNPDPATLNERQKYKAANGRR